MKGVAHLNEARRLHTSFSPLPAAHRYLHIFTSFGPIW
jgi:hypothetical protein